MILAVDDSPHIAAPVLVLLLIGAGILYGLGYARAVMHRANVDYKRTKEALPGLRKGFWRAWWKVVKVGFWVTLAFIGLVAWAVHDVSENTPAPAATVTPSPSRSHR